MNDNGSPGHDSTAADDSAARLTVWLTGQVQGVGMRWWIRARALELGLVGSAANLADGRVEVVAEGRRTDAQRLLAMVQPAPMAAAAGRPGRIAAAVERWDVARDGLTGFQER